MKEKQSGGADKKRDSKKRPVCSEPVAIPRDAASVTTSPEPSAIMLFAAGAVGLPVLRGRKAAADDSGTNRNA